MGPLFVREYGYVTPARHLPAQRRDGATVTCGDFAALKRLTLSRESMPSGAAPFRLCARDGGEALQALDHAGVILLPSGRNLEILPKLFPVDDPPSRERSRAVLLNMLRALPDFPFRSLPDTSLAHADLPLLENFHFPLSGGNGRADPQGYLFRLSCDGR